jgi:HD-GYP domain-containing protein (c-di-GMP phosphodiesterase class II)
MTADRTYRYKISPLLAVKEIKKCAGTQFDPQIVRVFVDKVFKKLEE